jgi:hypothetical protein
MKDKTALEELQRSVTSINYSHPAGAARELGGVLERIGADSPDAPAIKRAIDELDEIAAQMARIERRLSEIDFELRQAGRGLIGWGVGPCAEGDAWVSEISEAEFWDESCAFAPIKRMGFSNGPGASFGGEPWRLRNFGVTGRLAASHIAHFVIRDASDRPASSASTNPSPFEEFKPLCAAIIPGIGSCAMGYGEHL